MLLLLFIWLSFFLYILFGILVIDIFRYITDKNITDSEEIKLALTWPFGLIIIPVLLIIKYVEKRNENKNRR